MERLEVIPEDPTREAQERNYKRMKEKNSSENPREYSGTQETRKIRVVQPVPPRTPGTTGKYLEQFGEPSRILRYPRNPDTTGSATGTTENTGYYRVFANLDP
eukprot:1363012-Amorphochlora_amoeboformis.AAC.1